MSHHAGSLIAIKSSHWHDCAVAGRWSDTGKAQGRHCAGPLLAAWLLLGGSDIALGVDTQR
ncbi:hypothetical protein, partial [Stutzerimonas kunmingensis]|uniref:hypothetical protein n=1 Tax=Stutzerimonas kunmingensis TaxID=1211807 RepID=UPI00289771CF